MRLHIWDYKVSPEIPHDMQMWSFMHSKIPQSSIVELLKLLQTALKWNLKNSATRATPLCSPTAYWAPLLSVCVVLLDLLSPHAVCWCVCCVCYLSPSLSFSCFMVSPRKKYSFRSVILNAIKNLTQLFAHSPFAAARICLISFVV